MASDWLKGSGSQTATAPLRPRLVSAGAKKIGGENHNPHSIDENRDASLVPEKAAAVQEDERDEDRFARAGHGQDERPDRRRARAADQHHAHQRNQGSPVADDDVRDRSAEALAEGLPRSAASGAIAAYTIVSVSTPETIMIRWMLETIQDMHAPAE